MTTNKQRIINFIFNNQKFTMFLIYEYKIKFELQFF